MRWRFSREQLTSRFICPRCLVSNLKATAALSRRARVPICSICGQLEAFVDLKRDYGQTLGNPDAYILDADREQETRLMLYCRNKGIPWKER